MIDQILNILNHPLLANTFVKFGIIFVVFFLGAFVVSYFIESIILKFTAKTKTDVDHKIVKKIHKPLIFFMILIGVHIGIFVFTTLNLRFLASLAMPATSSQHLIGRVLTC